ncbi:YncE family protein [Telmatobacter sp. DSM 110680]|uniref:YncE family protein n=1 Tax=Telmatobacter sp. DSM 110680 TaxID=3036704 RepID=A0AAU7DN28_9BACT
MQTRRCLPTFARTLFAAPLLCTLFAATLVSHAEGPYKVLDHWKLADTGGWDYLLVDSAAHRVYITRGDHVDAVDTTSGKLIGTISGLHGTHGLALDPDGKVGYISDGGGNAVVVFDRSNLSTVATVPAGTNPDAIIFEPATKTVWAFNGRSKNISVIDAASRKVIATIDVPGKPEFGVADGQGNVYNNIEDKSEVLKIDARAHKVTATWPAGCESPSGLAMDIAGNRLFPVCDGNKMSVIDAGSGKILATPAIGDGPDAAGWDAKHKLAFASSGDGVLSVVDASTYKTIQSLPTKKGARTMAYDASTDRVYLVTADFGPRPAATAENQHPRPPMIPGSFEIIVVGR